MIELIDQSDPAMFTFRCSLCQGIIKQNTWALLDQHKCSPEALAKVSAVATPSPEPSPVPKKRGRPRKVEP